MNAIGDESKNYIVDFAAKLPYTRNSSVTNKLFIETAVTPLKFNNGNVVIQHSNVQQSEKRELTIQIAMGLSAAIAVMVISMLPFMAVKRRKRKAIEQFN